MFSMLNIDFDLFVLFQKHVRKEKAFFVLKVFWTVQFLVLCLTVSYSAKPRPQEFQVFSDYKTTVEGSWKLRFEYLFYF